MSSRADKPQGTMPAASGQVPPFGQVDWFAVTPGATLPQLLAAAASLLSSASEAYAACELADDAQFAAHHLMNQAQGAAGAARALNARGEASVTRPVDFFSFTARYQVAAGATVQQLAQDAHALAVSARAVLAMLARARSSGCDAAALHLVGQAAAVLAAVQGINERAERHAQAAQGAAR